MICPSCESDHLPELTLCPECGEVLVPRLPEVDHTAELVEVWSGEDADQVPLIESLLRDDGIPFVVVGQEAFGMLPVQPVGIRIEVSVEHVAAARRRLAQLEIGTEPSL